MRVCFIYSVSLKLFEEYLCFEKLFTLTLFFLNVSLAQDQKIVKDMAQTFAAHFALCCIAKPDDPRSFRVSVCSTLYSVAVWALPAANT